MLRTAPCDWKMSWVSVPVVPPAVGVQVAASFPHVHPVGKTCLMIKSLSTDS